MRNSMSIRASVYIATSLDGFISRVDGSLDWLETANAMVPLGEDCGYAAFMQTIDTLVMGRNTFEQVLTFDPWPYPDHKVIVLTSRPLTLPLALASKVSVMADSPRHLVDQLAARGAQHLYIDGGQTIQSFLSAGLINQITITVIPILLGAGRPLFGPLGHDQKLRLISSHAYEFGFVQSTYRVELGT